MYIYFIFLPNVGRCIALLGHASYNSTSNIKIKKLFHEELSYDKSWYYLFAWMDRIVYIYFVAINGTEKLNKYFEKENVTEAIQATNHVSALWAEWNWRRSASRFALTILRFVHITVLWVWIIEIGGQHQYLHWQL